MPYRVEVDKGTCISAGRCVADAPHVFRFDDDELSEVIPEAPQLPDHEIREIAHGCPAEAILLFEGEQPADID